MSAQHEYYVRQPADTEAQGPFTLAQLSSLAESGGIDARTLYFDAASEQWIPAAGSAELGILLRNALGKNVAGAPRLPRRPRPKKAAPPAANFARVLLFGGAVVFLLISVVHTLRQGSLRTLLFHPLFWFGVIDILLGACVALFGSRFALVIRLRAVLGLVFWSVLFWVRRHPVSHPPWFVVLAFALVMVALACLWLATVLRGRRALSIDAIAGLAARAAFAYFILSLS